MQYVASLEANSRAGADSSDVRGGDEEMFDFFVVGGDDVD